MHHTVLGNNFTWSRPAASFFNLDSPDKTKNFKTKLWHCFEFLLLILNTHCLGTPGSLSLKITDSILKYILFPGLKEKDDNKREIEAAERENRQPRFPKKKKEDEKDPYKIQDYMTFGSFFGDKISQLISELYTKHWIQENEIPNQDLFLTYRTREIPLWDQMQQVNSSQEEPEEEGAPEPEEHQEENQPRIGGLAGLMAGIDNLVERGTDFDDDRNGGSVNSFSNSSSNSSNNNGGGGGVDLDFGNITSEVFSKFKVHLVKIPSSISKDVNSVIFVITPLDPNFDAVQMIKYLTKFFIAKKKAAIASANTNGRRQQPKSQQNPAATTQVYGSERPFIGDDNFNSGSFFYENCYDVAKEYPMKCCSITDDSPDHIFNALISYFQLVELATFDEIALEDEINNMSNENPEEILIKRNKYIRKKSENLEEIVKDLEKQKDIFSTATEYDQYFDYNHGLNPNALFTFENAIRVINYLENSNDIENYDANEFFDNIHYKVEDVIYNEFKRNVQNNSNELKLHYNLIHEKVKKIMVNPEYPGMKIYHYEDVSNVCWMRNVSGNRITGLCNEVFPWATPIYSIPQNLLRYGKEKEDKQKKTTEDALTILSSSLSSSSSSSSSSSMQPNRTRNIREIFNSLHDNKGDGGFIDHPFAKWTTMPFDPTKHIESFVPSCHLPVGHNHVNLHGACLQYRYKYMEGVRPTNTQLFPEIDAPFYFGKMKIYHIQKVFNTLPIEFTNELKKSERLRLRWSKYCKIKDNALTKRLKDINDYSVFKQEYNLQTTLYFSDTFMNTLSKDNYKLTDSFNAMVNYYLTCSSANPNLITPAYYANTHGLGERAILPNEELFGLHIEDIARKLVVLTKAQGKQKVKILLALWSGIVLGHMDMTLPLKLHMMIAGDHSVGKSWILGVLKMFLVDGIVQMFSALTSNSMFTSGDKSGHVWISEETIEALFDVAERSDMVNFFKTLMSDGNLIKATCDIATGDRVTRYWNSFIRSCVVVAFNKAIQELNGPIRSRSMCHTLGKTLDEKELDNKKKKNKKSSEGSMVGKKRTRDFGRDNDGDDDDDDNEISEKIKTMTINDAYLSSMVIEKEKIKAIIKNGLDSTSENGFGSTTNEPTQRSQNAHENSSSTIDENSLKGKIVSQFHKDLSYLLKNRHYHDVTNDEVISFFQEKLIFAKDENANPSPPNNEQDYNNLAKEISNLQGGGDDEQAVDSSPKNAPSDPFIDICQKYFESNRQPSPPSSPFCPPSPSTSSSSSSSSSLSSSSSFSNESTFKNLIKINLLNNKNDEGNDKKLKQQEKANVQFDLANEAFTTVLQTGSANIFKNYMKFESLIAFMFHSGLLEGRLVMSSHLFWCLTPKFADRLLEKCPFIKLDNRSILKMHRIAYNLTGIKGFREEYMCPIDYYNGKINEKHFVPFKDFYILDIAPRLFMTIATITAGFTLVSEEFINPWYNSLFTVFFEKTTCYMDFVKSLVYYEKVIRKRSRKILSSEKEDEEEDESVVGSVSNITGVSNDDVELVDANGVSSSSSSSSSNFVYPPLFEEIKIRNPDSTRENPQYKIEHVMNIPALCLTTPAGTFFDPKDETTKKLKNFTMSLFKKAKFGKNLVDPGNVGMEIQTCDMNYIVLCDNCGTGMVSAGGGGSGGGSANSAALLSTPEKILANFVTSSSFGPKLDSIGKPALMGLLKQMMNESVIVNNSFELISHTVFTEMFEKIKLYYTKQRPLDRLFLRVNIKKDPETFQVLKIVNVKIQQNRFVPQLWLCVHSVAKTQSEGLLSSIVKSVLDESSTKEAISRLASLAVAEKKKCAEEIDNIKVSQFDRRLRDEFFETNTSFYQGNLETSVIGRNSKYFKENRQRMIKTLTIKNNSTTNAEDIDSHFFVDYERNSKPQIEEDKMDVTDDETTSPPPNGSFSFIFFFFLMQIENQVVVVDKQEEGSGVKDGEDILRAEMPSKYNPEEMFTNEINDITKEINRLDLEHEKQERNRISNKLSKSIETSSKKSNVDDEPLIDKSDSKSSKIKLTSDEAFDYKMRSLEIERDTYKRFIEEIKNQLPSSKIDIHIDLDEWAAMMHLTTSHCANLKFITELSKEDKEKGLSPGLNYLHKKIPIHNLQNDQIKDNYIKNEGEWRPVTSLSPNEISKRLFKLKWNYAKTPNPHRLVCKTKKKPNSY